MITVVELRPKQAIEFREDKLIKFKAIIFSSTLIEIDWSMPKMANSWLSK